MKQRMTVVSCLKVFEQINVPDVAGTAINTTKLKETRAHTYFMSAGPGGGRGVLLFHQQHQTLKVNCTRLHSHPTTIHRGLHHLTAETPSRRRVEEVPCANPRHA